MTGAPVSCAGASHSNLGLAGARWKEVYKAVLFGFRARQTHGAVDAPRTIYKSGLRLDFAGEFHIARSAPHEPSCLTPLQVSHGSTPSINHLDINLLLRAGFEETFNQVKLELTQRPHRKFLV